MLMAVKTTTCIRREPYHCDNILVALCNGHRYRSRRRADAKRPRDSRFAGSGPILVQRFRLYPGDFGNQPK
jgi:hypothetical protein